MAKRPQKRAARSEEDNLGCMWGLISMFDFRQGRSTQKLLPDRKHGSGIHVGTRYSRSKFDIVRDLERKREDVIASIANLSDVDGMEAGSVSLGTASIKTLMEEEMSSAHPSKKLFCPEVERIKPDLGFGGNLEKNHKQRGKNYRVASDHHANDSRTSVNKSGQSNCANESEKPYFDLDLAASFPPMKRTGHNKDNHHDKPDVQLIQKHLILQKEQCDVTKAFLTEKSIVAKQLTGNGEFYQSKELMDALESPNLNKELFLKLLQDPDLLHKLQNAQAGKFSGLESCRNLEGSELIGEEIGSSGQREELVSRKLFHIQNAFSWKKDKPKGTKPSKGSESDSPRTSNKIVVLKPNTARNQNPSILINPGSSVRSDYSLQQEEGSERVSSYFSLKEIKRRLRHAIGESRKEQLLIAMDGVLHRIPHESKDSGDIQKKGANESLGTSLTSKTSCAIEHTGRSSAKRTDNIAKSKECQPNMESAAAYAKVSNHKKLSMEAVAHPLYRESFFYEEAKQHLTEMLSTGGQNETLPTMQVSKTLGILLSFPGYNLLSPRFSPGRDTEPDSPQKLRSSHVMQFKQETSADQLSLSKQDITSSSWTSSIQDDKPQVLDSNTALFDTDVQAGKDLIPKESMETMEAADQRDRLVVSSEISSNKRGITCERCKEEGSTLLSELGPTEERPQLVSSSVSILPSSVFIQKLEVPEILMEIPERPSPVSVLEPFFLDDISSPGRTIEQDEYSVQPRRIHFEEHGNYEVVLASSDSEANPRTRMEDMEAKFEYVRALLEASGISYNKLSKRWHLSDQLLDPFLFDEVEISSSHLPDDPKLLFDCTNEVLVGIWERIFGCTPWLSIIRPNVQPILVGGNLIQEVCKGIDWHLHSHSPRTIDQAVREDLDCGTWMNLRRETESSVFEMGDAILEDLMEETVLELWG